MKFPHDDRLLNWVASVSAPAWTAVDAPENAPWHQCEGTWFVGVDALPSDGMGAVEPGMALGGTAYEFATHLFGSLALHPAQLSVIYPGYPKPEWERAKRRVDIGSNAMRRIWMG